MSQVTAFFRVEGVLIRRTAAACAAALALGQRDVLGRFARLGPLAAALPGAGLLGSVDAWLPDRLMWRGLAGCSEDRLVVLGEDYWTQHVEKSWNDPGLRLVERSLQLGWRVVLLSDHPSHAIGPLQARLGAHALLCNHLEVEDGEATGRLRDPVVTGRADGTFLRAWARDHGVAPGDIAAYGHAAEDATLLSGAARPCAVTPAPGLRRPARELDWPIVEA